MDEIAPCEKCKGDCCYNVPVTKEELIVMMKARPRKINRLRVDRDALPNHSILRGKCPWLSNQWGCDIYESRPYVCRVIGNAKNPCSHMEGGKEHIEKRIEKLTNLKKGNE